MERLNEFIRTNQDRLGYLAMCHEIIKRHWDDLKTNIIVFRDVESSKSRKALYLLIDACELKFYTKNTKTKEFVNEKVVNHPPKGYDITFHSLRCEDCPEIEHPSLGECPRHKDCKFCNKLDLTVIKKYKDIYIKNNKFAKLIELNLKIPKCKEPKYEIIRCTQ